MDNYRKVIELIDHPENFTDSQIAEMMADEEMLRLYNALCDADSALKTRKASEEDVEKAWRRFSTMHSKQKPKGMRTALREFLRQRRAASVAAIVICSVTVLAIGFGAIRQDGAEGNMTEASTLATSPTREAIRASASLPAHSDTLSKSTDILIFEDKTLGTILTSIAEYYGLKIDSHNEAKLSLRLFFRWDKSKSPADVIAQLDNFDNIDIRLKGNVIILL